MGRENVKGIQDDDEFATKVYKIMYRATPRVSKTKAESSQPLSDGLAAIPQ